MTEDLKVALVPTAVMGALDPATTPQNKFKK